MACCFPRLPVSTEGRLLLGIEGYDAFMFRDVHQPDNRAFLSVLALPLPTQAHLLCVLPPQLFGSLSSSSCGVLGRNTEPSGCFWGCSRESIKRVRGGRSSTGVQ